MGFSGRIVRLSQLIADTITGVIINGGTINGATIIGSTLETASTGTRVVVSTSPAFHFGAVQFYTGVAAEQQPGFLVGESAGTVNGVQLAQVGLTAPQLTNNDTDPPFIALTTSAAGSSSNTLKISAGNNTDTGGTGLGTIQLEGRVTMQTPPAGTVRAKTTVPNFDMIYPVGSIYMSVNSTNPGSLFGGTWAAWAVGRMPVGVDPSQPEFNAPEAFGGEKTHLLTAAESGIPAKGGGVVYQQNSGGYYFNVGSDADSTHRANVVSGGASAATAHNNLPPYLTCYIWKRTA